MATFQVGHTPGDPRVEVHVDLESLRQTAHVGVRRAAAFLGLGLQATKGGPPKSVSLEESFTYRFLPDPLPQHVAENISAEYEAWIVAGALKELDQYLSLFLDEAWNAARVGALQGNALDWGDPILDQKFAMRTNVGDKLAAVAKSIGLEIDIAPHRSLSSARNALTHTRGIVCPQHTNDEGALVVSWIAPRAYLQEGNTERPLEAGTRVEHPDGATAFARVELHSVRFALGTQVNLTPRQLSEVCFFYLQQAELVVSNLTRFLEKCGLPLNPHPSSAPR